MAKMFLSSKILLGTKVSFKNCFRWSMFRKRHMIKFFAKAIHSAIFVTKHSEWKLNWKDIVIYIPEKNHSSAICVITDQAILQIWKDTLLQGTNLVVGIRGYPVRYPLRYPVILVHSGHLEIIRSIIRSTRNECGILFRFGFSCYCKSQNLLQNLL